MKSHELAKILLAQPDREVILANTKDDEGNRYSPMHTVDLDVVYIAKSPWSGDVYSKEWDATDADATEEEWEEIKKNHSGFVVFWPVN